MIMKPYENTRFVVIGFGFLMGYITPCYSQFFDKETIADHVVAVTADAGSLQEKQKKYPFPILLNDNMKALKQMKPDVILFAPPPSVAPGLAKEVLKPYYDACRAAGETLPDLYAFPPSPQGKFYLDLLGGDVYVCNILPNMMSEINGISLNGAEGNTHITIPAEGPWAAENLRRLETVFAPLGGTIYVPTENVLDMLATLCIVEVIPLLLFNLADGANIDSQVLASAMRWWHQKRYDYHPAGSTPCSREGVPEVVNALLMQMDERWMKATVDFLVDVGMPKETAERILIANVDLKLHCCQLQPREKTEDDLRNHATKGGVAERARMCYEILLEPVFQKRFTNVQELLSDPKFFDLCEDVAYEISRIVAIHGRKLDGDSNSVVLKPDHAAMLFALFVRNAKAMAGESGATAAHEGLLLYADQRGSRMAKRASAHNAPNTMLNYMVFGEWSALPGTMIQENVELVPNVVTHVHMCPWYTVWKRMGFLEEGEEYCKYIDYNLVKGFNSELELGVNQVRTCGAPYCEFVWNGCALDATNAAYLEEQKKVLGDSCKKDWLYHTQHTYSAMKEKLADLPQYSMILEKTMKDFEVLYGSAIRKAVEDCEAVDFYAI